MNPIEKLGALVNYNIRLINMTSKGLLSKGWFNINGKICLVKGNLDWHEPYSEVLASNLAEVLGLRHITSWLEPASIFSSIKTYYNCEHVSVCEKYELDGEYYLKTFYSFMSDYYGNKGVKQDDMFLCDYKQVIFELPQRLLIDLSSMLYFDAIICNVDRHLRNIEFICNGDVIVGLLPIYDCGMSLLHDRDEKLYIADYSKPFIETHNKQTEFLREHGLQTPIVYCNDTLDKWISLSQDIFDILGERQSHNIINFVKRRLDLYGRLQS